MEVPPFTRRCFEFLACRQFLACRALFHFDLIDTYIPETIHNMMLFIDYGASFCTCDLMAAASVSSGFDFTHFGYVIVSKDGGWLRKAIHWES
jgi:hypothetical protein